MRLIFALFMTLCLALPAMAQERSPVVVELFTSQGCSSCPPADAVLAELADEKDIIALALHVDYWDYLGWADKFADPAFSYRQKQYANAVDERRYTPQIVIDGKMRVVGSQTLKVSEAIMKAAKDSRPVVIRHERKGNAVQVRLAAVKLTTPQMVQLFRVNPGETVQIDRGENAGKAVHYVNIVRQIKTVAQWDGRDDLTLRMTLPNTDRFAIVSQDQGLGPVRGATWLD